MAQVRAVLLRTFIDSALRRCYKQEIGGKTKQGRVASFDSRLSRRTYRGLTSIA